MQISFDPTNQDERDAVAVMLEALDENNGEAKTTKRTRKPKAEANTAPVVAEAAPVAAPVAAAPVAAAPVAAAPVAAAPAFAPVQSSGVTQIQVTQAIQAFTSRYKVAGAKQRLAEFAKAYGLPEKMSIDQIPQEMYAQAVEAFKVD